MSHETKAWSRPLPELVGVVAVLGLGVVALTQELRHHPLAVQLVQHHHAGGSTLFLCNKVVFI